MRMPRRQLLLLSLATPALAQPAFNRPIRVLVAYPPGGASDLTIRALANGVTEQVGQSLVIENRSGASGGIALAATARAQPDGHFFCVAAEGAIYRTLLRDDLGYHGLRDLAPVAMLVSQPIVAVAHPSLGVNTLPELIALARRTTTPLPYVVSGTGGTQTFAAAVMAERLGITLEAISYRGGGQAINDLVGGQVPLGFLGTPPVMGHVREGRLRILAVASPRRLALLPEVPTIAEAAGLDGFAFEQWQGVFAPRDTPPAFVTRFSAALAAALRRDDARGALAALGLEPVGEDPATFARRLEREAKLWAEEGARLGLTG
jgi:tripartite-type tricarboxylate transporter receptor subunit TctC